MTGFKLESHISEWWGFLDTHDSIFEGKQEEIRKINNKLIEHGKLYDGGPGGQSNHIHNLLVKEPTPDDTFLWMEPHPIGSSLEAESDCINTSWNTEILHTDTVLSRSSDHIPKRIIDGT